jgi:two-component system sensor histidine kinase KdpD
MAREPGSAIRGWTTQLGAATLGRQRPQRSTGILAAIASVGLATLAIYFLRKIAPVVSLSVVYLPAVLLVATYWGIWLGLFTSLLSAASFNFFHIPPTGKFTIVDGRNWVALAAFTIVALFASALAELARSRAQEAERRRAEADLAAALAHELLLGEDTQAALASAARRVAEALELTSAAIEPRPAQPATLDPHRTLPPPPDPRRIAFPLRGIDGEQMATLLVPAHLPADTEQRLRSQVVPTLEALVAIAQRRDAMQAELVETAALRRSDDIKTALLRAVSHDLRTPLTAVVAAGHALGADSLTSEERSELSAAVVEEGTRLAGLVDNLLALSVLQAGSATPRSDWVSIEDLVSAAAEGLRGWAGGEPVSVRVSIDPDVPEIRADAAQLERAFANLLENAGRYGGGSPVVVHARRGGGPPGEGVLVSVTDQGPGIDAAEQERIFEPFYRGRNVGSLAWTGSGLGLAIVKGFVEANGGSITVQSFPGQGTTFYVLLPVEEHEPTASAEPTRATKAAEVATGAAKGRR